MTGLFLAGLRWRARSLRSPLRGLCEELLSSPEFAAAPASRNKHHAYPGGLVVHTHEVLTFAEDAGGGLDEDQRTVLRTAAIWHDCAKTGEYRRVNDGQIEELPFKKLIYHVAGSYGRFWAEAMRAEVEPALMERIGHCILAHHGRREWGSPVEPQTPEAWILHTADMWSSRFGPHRDGPPVAI